MLRTVLLVLLVGLVLPAAAQNRPAVPELTGRIVDNARILSPSTEAVLTERLAAYEDSTSNQIAVLTVPSLRGAVLEEYATEVFRTWGLGTAEADNGILVLIARDDRKIRIEVGYGLEGSVTDAAAGRIIRNEMTPRFRQDDFDGGVLGAVDVIMAVADGALYEDPPPPPPGVWGWLLSLVGLGGIGAMWNATWRKGVARVPMKQILSWALLASLPMYPVVRLVTSYLAPVAHAEMNELHVLLAGALVWAVVAIAVEVLWWRRPRRSRWRQIQGALERRRAEATDKAAKRKRTVRFKPGLFGGEVVSIDGAKVAEQREKARQAAARRSASRSSGGGFSGGGGSSGGGGASGGW